MILKAQAVKEKLDKFDFTKIKNFCASKDRVKSQHIEWEKIFASHMSDKGLLSRIYKELL